MNAHQAACRLEDALVRYEAVVDLLARLAAGGREGSSLAVLLSLRRIAPLQDPWLRALCLEGSQHGCDIPPDAEGDTAWVADLARRLVAAASTCAFELHDADVALREALHLGEVFGGWGPPGWSPVEQGLAS